MDKKYFYHPSMFISEHIFISILYSLIMISWIVPFILNNKFENFQFSIFRISILITFTFLIASHLIKTLFANLKGTVFVLTYDDIIKKTPRKIITIPYADICQFKFIRFPFTSGYGLLKSSDDKIRFLFFIDNLNDLLTKLEDNLHMWKKESIINKKEMDKFKYVAAVSKYVNDYVFHSIKPLITVILYITISSVIIAFRIWNLPPVEALTWTLYSIIYPLLSYLIIHYLITQKISQQIRDAKMKVKDIGSIDTSRIISYSVLISAIIYLLSGILYNFL